MKLKIYKVLFIILIILAIVTISFIVIKYAKNYEAEIENKKTVETFSRVIESEEKQDVTMNGYKIIRNSKNSKDRNRISNCGYRHI